MGYLSGCKVPPHRKTISYKEEKSVLEKLAGYHLNHTIKVNVFSTGTTQNGDPCRRGQGELSVTAVIHVPKMQNLSLIMRKHETNFNGGILYNICDLRKCQGCESHGKTEEVFVQTEGD